VLVCYEATGHDVDVLIQRWVTTATDPASGCATEGRLEDFADLTANVDAQGAINDGAITSHLPGAYAPDTSIPAEHFGEAALDLAALLDEAFRDECLAYRSIWIHSRSSPSDSSNLQDYVAPRRPDVRTCAASGTKFFDSNANGERDPGARGIPRFLIWPDYDNDGVRDDDEPFSVSDNRGRYVIFDIHGTGHLHAQGNAPDQEKPSARDRLGLLVPQRRHRRWNGHGPGRTLRMCLGSVQQQRNPQ